MAFESLSDKLNATFKKLRGKGRLTELDISEAMREVRLALLEAADGEGITLSYEEKQAVEGKKRKQLVKVTRRYPYDEVRYTKEYLDFK